MDDSANADFILDSFFDSPRREEEASASAQVPSPLSNGSPLHGKYFDRGGRIEESCDAHGNYSGLLHNVIDLGDEVGPFANGYLTERLGFPADLETFGPSVGAFDPPTNQFSAAVRQVDTDVGKKRESAENGIHDDSLQQLQATEYDLQNDNRDATAVADAPTSVDAPTSMADALSLDDECWIMGTPPGRSFAGKRTREDEHQGEVAPVLKARKINGNTAAPKLEKSDRKKTRTRTADLDPSLVHICPVCGKKFAKRYNQKIHQKRHEGDLPFLCTYRDCGKSFMWRSSFLRHLKVHQNRTHKNPPSPVVAKDDRSNGIATPTSQGKVEEEMQFLPLSESNSLVILHGGAIHVNQDSLESLNTVLALSVLNGTPCEDFQAQFLEKAQRRAEALVQDRLLFCQRSRANDEKFNAGTREVAAMLNT